jgi:hypothetical protein
MALPKIHTRNMQNNERTTRTDTNETKAKPAMADAPGENATTKRGFFRRNGAKENRPRKGLSPRSAPPRPPGPPPTPERPPAAARPSKQAAKPQPQPQQRSRSRIEASRSSSDEDFVHVQPPSASDDEEAQRLLLQPPSLRRISIRRHHPLLSSYQSTPITKQYEISKQILAIYDSHYSAQLWVTAYAMGLQFVELALLEIPKHGYFFSERHERERMENCLAAARVSRELLDLPGADVDQVRRLLRLALGQVEQASSDQEKQLSYEHRRAEVEEQSVYDPDWVVCEPSTLLASCSDSLAMSFSFAGGGNPALVEEPPTQDWLPVDEANDIDESSASLTKALLLAGIELNSADDASREDPPGLTLERSSSQLEIATLATVRHRDFDELLQRRRIKIRLVNTYQGNTPGSTNGCAVIAPLLCSKHLRSKDDNGLTDADVEEAIDVESLNVLQALRSKLGIPDQAFLIPSDANDYLLDHGFFKQDQFLTVAGGNILDENHVRAFLKVLEDEKTREKVAATVFFHEHVFCILKVPVRRSSKGRVSYRYDLIDSLPHKDTLIRLNETREEMCQRLGIYEGLTDVEVAQENEMSALPRTVCFRCGEIDALMGLLWWYACSKFTQENMKYIDQIKWDDAANDFDPRVFQAFVVSVSLAMFDLALTNYLL